MRGPGEGCLVWGRRGEDVEWPQGSCPLVMCGAGDDGVLLESLLWSARRLHCSTPGRRGVNEAGGWAVDESEQTNTSNNSLADRVVALSTLIYVVMEALRSVKAH
jgi:hypothetical protein